MIADMGAGSGAVAHRWFDAMFSSVQEIGVAFTAIGVITPDPASVESVLSWANALQRRVDYLIVKNALTDPADFTYWDQTPAAAEFRRIFQPKVIEMEYRLPKVENPARQHGLTINRVADRKVDVPELQQTTVVMRAQAYRRNLFAELERGKGNSAVTTATGQSLASLAARLTKPEDRETYAGLISYFSSAGSRRVISPGGVARAVVLARSALA